MLSIVRHEASRNPGGAGCYSFGGQERPIECKVVVEMCPVYCLIELL